MQKRIFHFNKSTALICNLLLQGSNLVMQYFTNCLKVGQSERTAQLKFREILLPFAQLLISFVSEFSKLLGLGEQLFCLFWEGLQQ